MNAFRIPLTENRSCSLNKSIAKFLNFLFYYHPPTQSLLFTLILQKIATWKIITYHQTKQL